MVLPEPLANQYSVKVKPTFELEEFPLSYDVQVGSTMSLKLPEGLHDDPNVKVFYKKPDRG